MSYIIISGIVFIIRILIKEIGKSRRITQFKKMDNNKIESIGNYEKKSKTKYFNPSFWKKRL